MYEMNSNVFSISPEIIVTEKGFDRLNKELRARGFQEEVAYAEITKMEGLLRCSTLPLTENKMSQITNHIMMIQPMLAFVITSKQLLIISTNKQWKV